MPSDVAKSAYTSVPPAEMVGPLTLLLGLIRQHEVDVFDIPIAFITERYLEAIATLDEALDIERGGDFVSLAGELLHIKSLMLLPKPKLEVSADEGADPRRELVGRLLALDGFRDAGEALLARPILGRDTFEGGSAELTEGARGSLAPLAALDVYKLTRSLHKVARRQELHDLADVSGQGLSIREKIVAILDLLARRSKVTLIELVGGDDVFDWIAAFIAVLETVKMGLATVSQRHLDGEIVICTAHAEVKASP